MQWYVRLAELAEDWGYLIRRDGWRAALPVVGQELAWLPYRRLNFVVLARSLLDPLPDVRPKIVLEVREFEPPDLELVRQTDRPSEVRLCARRLARGHRGFLALHKGQLAGRAWASDAVDPELERVSLRLDPGDVLCTDAYTVPAFRGQGVHTALTLARFHLCRGLGYRRAIAYIEASNGSSLAVWRERLDAQVIEHFEFIRVGLWRRVRYG